MKRFDVFTNPAGRPGLTPFVVVLTSHHLQIEAVLVAPLIRRRHPVEGAEIALAFGGMDYVLSLIAMAAIDPRRLRDPVGSLADQEDVISRAIDRLFTGF